MSKALLELLRQITNPEDGVDTAPLIEQLTTGIEGQTAMIDEHTQTIGNLNTEMTGLKARNYDLVSQIPTKEDVNNSAGAEGDDEKPIMVKDLFKSKKDGE